tara:strand:- start:153 stop:338 length:186 start_codon:yes stop_codon:yes gene_type:complete
MKNTEQTQPWKTETTCECGCEKVYTPVRPWQKFAEKDCREKYWTKLRCEAYKIVKEKALTH